MICLFNGIGSNEPVVVYEFDPRNYEEVAKISMIKGQFYKLPLMRDFVYKILMFFYVSEIGNCLSLTLLQATPYGCEFCLNSLVIF